ncbi:hypothetical protein CEXT_758441 [Caerostris extrusa]|uniref:Uncharacterized protein n=1 Tax=Caerostris extrusa TaxID=172846 RepID=A0AAV4N4A7_CAEEX|nr:hypothetical protein CEXT_758441 [Caerostris extrusa]
MVNSTWNGWNVVVSRNIHDTIYGHQSNECGGQTECVVQDGLGSCGAGGYARTHIRFAPIRSHGFTSGNEKSFTNNVMQFLRLYKYVCPSRTKAIRGNLLRQGINIGGDVFRCIRWSPVPLGWLMSSRWWMIMGNDMTRDNFCARYMVWFPGANSTDDFATEKRNFIGKENNGK